MSISWLVSAIARTSRAVRRLELCKLTLSSPSTLTTHRHGLAGRVSSANSLVLGADSQSVSFQGLTVALIYCFFNSEVRASITTHHRRWKMARQFGAPEDSLRQAQTASTRFSSQLCLLCCLVVFFSSKTASLILVQERVFSCYLCYKICNMV